MERLAPLYTGTTAIEMVNNIIADLKQEHEPWFKKALQHWLQVGVFTEAAMAERVQKFMKQDYQYFSGTSFFDNELTELNDLIRETWQSINDYLFVTFKAITVKQVNFLELKQGSGVHKVSAEFA
jgi:hypothetical protein